MATLTIADLDNGKRDLQTVAEVATSRAATATTRFGQQTTTLYESIRRINATGDAILANLGYLVPVDYAPGLSVTDPNFTVVGPDGKIYAAQAGQLPFTTGAWNPDQWYPVQNDLNDRKLLIFGTKPEAAAAAAVLPDGQALEIESDADHEGRRTRNVVEAGAVVFVSKQEYFSVDDFPSLQEAVNCVASALGVLVATGSHNLSETLVIPSAAGMYTLDFSGSRFIVAPGVKRAIEIGTRGANPWRGVLKQPSLEKLAFEGGDEGIVLVNAVEYEIDSPRVNRISKSLVWAPESSCRVTSGVINNPTLQNHEFGIYAEPSGGGYANDNTVLAGRFPINVSDRLIDQIYLDNSTGTGVQHNRFIGVNIEGWSGGGSCGRSAINCINGADQNVFLYPRVEKYGTGWSSGNAVIFGAGTTGNVFEDNRLDVSVLDSSGANNWRTVTQDTRNTPSSSGAASPMLKYTRRMPVSSEAYLIDLEDAYASSGSVAFLRYKTARSSGVLLNLESGAGKVLDVRANGAFYTPITREGPTTGEFGYGYRVQNTVVGATNNYGYWANLPNATGNWNFYGASSAPSYFGGKIYTAGSLGATPATSFTGFLGFSNTSSSTGAVAAEYTTNNTAARHHVSFSNPNGVVGSISTNGSATLFNTSSDVRLKENIRDSETSGEVIDSLKVRSFEWRASGENHRFGFIAQELYEHFPEAVSASDDEEAMWSVDYSKLVPLLVKEIQHLRERLAALESPT